ncbi:putative transcription regulator with HTH domain protein [Tolypothrix sp. NIES-4075]|uniref:helix-turn-helix domain-containing protein n=1 Tax=Tolypothrix sp. NIES-4075 TaxID=2005459 RepID=UPI000B5C5D9E|nr:transcriptional regulator [Tolypothrix sp. NIES-4075]GAX39487.1 putative transcription regulator with HTH domain protein [Tolypothrix sp. NIES-4075]
MTSGLKTLSSYYIQLITTFAPRPITNEAELIATQNRINFILDNGNLTQDDKDYLKVLGTLVYDYEEKYEAMPILKGVTLLKTLLEESNLQPKDLIHICESESNILDILNGKAKLTDNQIKELTAFFKISPRYFVEEN